MDDTGDKESKTEAASEKKIRDSLEKGQGPHSREAAIFAAVAATLCLAVFLLRDATLRLSAVLVHLFDAAAEVRFETGGDGAALTAALIFEIMSVLLPIVALFIGFGLASSFLQGMPRIVSERIQFDLSRLSPTKGWARLFGLRGAGEFAKVLAKFVGISLVCMLMLRTEQGAAVASIHAPPGDLPERILAMLRRLIGAMAIVSALVAALDLVLTQRNWRRDLMMSRQELKDEHKQSEGDPAVKGRFRSIARDRARRRMIAAVPRATLIIANPTHYAVAIRYLRSEGGAPLVIAKGQDLVALKIREIAEAQNIPVIEDKALARALFGVAEVDAQIPALFYRAVAEIIHFLGARAGREWRGTSEALLAGLGRQ